MIDTPYERILITVHYACGCYKAQFVFRTPEAEAERAIGSTELCDFHQMEYDQTKQRRVELAAQAAADRAAYALDQRLQKSKRYLIDGKSWSIFQDRTGLWRGKHQEQGKVTQKNFGRADPRPLLEVAK